MSLIAQRCIWDWADWIAKKQNERIGLVLVELLTAIDGRELLAYLAYSDPSSDHEMWRGMLPMLVSHYKGADSALRRIGTIPAPLPEGGLPLPRLVYEIMIAASDVEAWLEHRLVQPSSKKTSRNEKQSKIMSVAAELTGTPEWEVSAKRRCRLVEKKLKQPEGWCNERTLSRALNRMSER
jgi:hypothetical protein